MNKQSSDNPDQQDNNFDEEVCANLSIYVDNEGNIAYNCDWEPTDAGLVAIASIFYKLMVDDLPAKIFEEIKAQCVLNNAETDFMTIESIFYKFAANNKNEDSVVVPPDKIINL